RDRPFRIHQCGIKAYPAVVYSQTAIVAALEVARQAGDLERITAIEVATTRRGFQQAGSEPEKWAPDTRETADHSLPYLVARAMFDGDISNDSYAPDKLRDTRILAFMRRITVREDPAFAKPARQRAAPPHPGAAGGGRGGPPPGRRHAGLPGKADDPRRGRAEIPRQCRQALVRGADRRDPAGILGARAHGRSARPLGK